MKFEFISVKRMIEGMETAVRRFPSAALTAFAGTVIGLVLIHIDEPGFYPNLLMTLMLGFPLFIAVVLFGGQQAWTSNKKIIINCLAAAFLTAYYFWLPENILKAQDMFIIRYVMWTVGFALLVTFVPFLKKNEERVIEAFWRYNRILFFSLALTALWAAAIQIGISIAIASVDFLFNVHVEPERYAELGVIVAGLFSTIFFLSRIPKDIQHFQKEEEYPKELLLFSQYVLVPLVMLYFLILYAYVVRILVLWEWPKGTLAYMILGFSFLGMAAYVILYPLRDKMPWARKSGNIFHIVLIPQAGMLFWALWFRISQYGFTENRYFVFIFGWWLLAMAVYFLVSRKKDIRIIPITIFIIAFLSSFGPWGAFAVSERSQTNRLEKLLVKNDLFINGTVQKAAGKVTFDDQKEISSMVRYLNDVHGLDGIQPWFSKDFSALKDNEKAGKDSSEQYRCRTLPQKVVEELIGIEYIAQWEAMDSQSKSFYFYTDYQNNKKILDISQYDYMAEIDAASGDIAEINGAHYRFRINDNSSDFVILKDEGVIAQINFKEFLDNLLQQVKRSNLERDKMKVEFKNENISFAIYFSNINGEKIDKDKYKINSINAKLLFTFKP
jgi:hypothetical protein